MELNIQNSCRSIEEGQKPISKTCLFWNTFDAEKININFEEVK